MNLFDFLKRNTISLGLLASFSGCTYVVITPGFLHAHNSARRSTCQSNLKRIWLACALYTNDGGGDGHFMPLSSDHSLGWTQLLEADGKQDYSCPEGRAASFSPSSDYFFNAQLATRKTASVRDPMFTVAFGEGLDNAPSNSHYTELFNDLNNEDSPMRRHYGGANFAFADGHVKWLSPGRLFGWQGYDEDNSEFRYKMSPTEVKTRLVRQSQPPSAVKNAKARR